MSIHFHRLTHQKSTSVVRAGSSSAILVPFSSRSRQRAEIGPNPFTCERSSAEAAIRPVPVATGEAASGRPRPSAVIIDFAQARRSRHTARIREEPSSENPRSLTLANLVAIIYALVATAFYPAMAWFLIHS
jgi:hypothetical protein